MDLALYLVAVDGQCSYPLPLVGERYELLGAVLGADVGHTRARRVEQAGVGREVDPAMDTGPHAVQEGGGDVDTHAVVSVPCSW